jgi:putative transposase
MPPEQPRIFPHASNLRAGRTSAPGEAYYVTKCTDGRCPLLANPQAAEVIIESLAHSRDIGRIKLLAFVVMHDHYHVLFILTVGSQVPTLMQSTGSYTANQIRKHLGHRGVVWQPDGYHEHRCRSQAEVLDCAEYIHHNPVRKGYVERAEDWVYSSAHPSRRSMLDWDWWA